MIDLKNFISAIAQIEEEKGIDREKILETVEMALAAAYKKDYGEKGQIIKAKLDTNSGSFDIWQEKIVVDESMIKSEEELEEERKKAEEAGEEPREGRADDEEMISEEGELQKVRFNEQKHIWLADARGLTPREGSDPALLNPKKIKLGDVLKFPLELREDFGRIAAQTAKQVIIQRIREAERESVFEEYSEKADSIVSGVVQRIEGNTIFFDLGKTTALMLAKDRIPRERYHIGQRLRLFLVSLEHGAKGPQVFVSRSHPKMLSRLFELEVPEITAGTVEIKALAREAGLRSKIAVASNEEGVDPIGSCVGQRGTRVSAVIQELGGEKIDIIEWKEDPEEFIASALSPAKVLDVEADSARAKVIVSEDQLSLAIGKDGQNVRLAAKLTGWKIDILSKETGEVEQSSEEPAEKQEQEEKIKPKKTKKPGKTNKKTKKKSKDKSKSS
ncbi:MAG: transcription termination factor NusA [Candidatus Spechtbacterales bacterium]